MANPLTDNVPPLKIDSCPLKLIKGPIDIDSTFVLTANLLPFAPDCVNRVHVNSTTYKLSTNVKGTKELEKLLLSRGIETTFSKYSWWESKVMTIGKYSIYVLFLVDSGQQHYFNIYSEFVRHVIRRAFEALPITSRTRKEYVGPRLNSHDDAKVFEEDYYQFSLAAAYYTLSFVKDQGLVRQVYFYNCIHGMKGNVPPGIKSLKSLLRLPHHSYFILFIQVHFGFTVDCLENTAILLHLKKIKTEFLNSDWNMRKMYFLNQFGHFFDVTEIYKFPRISYTHCYETAQHRISRERFSKSLFCYELINGFLDESSRFQDHARSTIDVMNNLMSLRDAHKECLDIRIEIVENFYDTNDLFGDKIIADRYSAEEGPLPSISCFPAFLDMLVRKKSFILLRNWNEYVDSQIGANYQFMKRLLLKKKTGSPPTIEHLNQVYLNENKLIAFLDGNKKRHDHEALNSYRVFKGDLPYYSIDWSTVDDFTISKTIFENSRWTYFGAECRQYFEILYTLSELIVDNPIHYFFETLALFRNCMLCTGTQKRKVLKVETYFTSKKEFECTSNSSRDDVLNAIIEPRNVVMKLIVGHCFASKSSYSESIQSSLRTFIKHHVKYFPAKFLDTSAEWGSVVKILDDEQMLNLGVLLSLTGRAKRQLNLKQNKKLKRALGPFIDSLRAGNS